MGRGCNKPCGDWCVSLAQTEQAATKSTTSPLISGHQNFCWMKDKVLLAPGWPEKWEECPHSITRALKPAGTYWLQSGHPLGVASDPTASLTSWSVSIWTALANICGVGALKVAGEGVRLDIFRARSVG